MVRVAAAAHVRSLPPGPLIITSVYQNDGPRITFVCVIALTVRRCTLRAAAHAAQALALLAALLVHKRLVPNKNQSGATFAAAH